tara:strand:+ start:1057 stop:1824 length:768 start_codon:yes stop_codon:yes gene_type:complete
MKTYSYSQLNAFKSCGEKYKIIYIDNKKNAKEGIEAFMGKRVHDTLEWIYKYSERVLFKDIEEFYDDNWAKNWHKEIYAVKDISSDEYYKTGKHCLANYYYKYGPEFNQNSYATEMMINFNLDEFSFRGIIDRLDCDSDGNWIIHDYKAGKRILSVPASKKDGQLALYQMAIMQEPSIKNIKSIELRWHFLQQGIERSVIHTEESLNKIKENLKGMVHNIIDSNEFEPKETMLCNWCHYWEDCSAKETTNPARQA